MAGCQGAVIGALTKDGGVDLSLTQRLGAAARPELALTFHRAIDLTTDPLAAVRSLVDLRDATGQVRSSGSEGQRAKAQPIAWSDPLPLAWVRSL
jgi:copper homeostasis protein